MKSTVENLSPTRVRLAVEVPFDDLKPGLDAAYKKIGSQVRVPGFRPGKVPARVIDQRVGRGAVLEEVVNTAIPQFYSEAAREHELKVISQPEVDITKIEDGDVLAFTAEVDIRPEITLPDLSGIELTVDDVTVSDADVAAQLDELRARFGTLTGVERPVQEGDYVSLDLSAEVDGEAIEEGAASGLSYRVGDDDLVDGLDEALVGKSAGESATLTTTLRQGEHAGDEAQVTATIKSVKQQELPEADDEFAQLASEFDTITELENDLRERLARVKALEQGAQARDKLLETLIERIEFPLPESVVQNEVDVREHEVVHSLNHDDELYERYLEAQETTKEAFLAELREQAEQSVRAQLILDAIADSSDVQIGDAELSEYIVRQAMRYQMAPQEFANQVVQAGNLPQLVADVRRNKALADLLQSAVITDASGNPVDIAALGPALADDAEPDAFGDGFGDGLDGDAADLDGDTDEDEAE